MSSNQHSFFGITEFLSLRTRAIADRRRAWLIVLVLLLLPPVFVKRTIQGDGTEYVMMAHAFYRHATPALTSSDLADVAALPDELVARSELARAQLLTVPYQIEHDGGMPLGFAPSTSHGIQAIHFWMYSLVATPFYALASMLGVNPALAFAILNLSIFCLSVVCIQRWFPKAGFVEAAFVALMGPVMYLHWTGPEVFSASCALVALFAMVRRDMPLAMALAGLGATQNPAIAGLIPAAGAYWGLLKVFPEWAWAPGPAVDKPRWRNVALVLAGVLLAALPYLYDEVVFGMPSIIAPYFTDKHLITWERMHSFFFDLNQGMFVGLPGLALSLVLLPILLDKPFRWRWLAYAAGAIGLSMGLALPALAATNWNNGCIIFLRYAYWAAMPIVGVCVLGLTHLPVRRRRAVLACVVLCQVVTIGQTLWRHGNKHVCHSLVADWVLDHAPQLYHPDPEIFYERELHQEEYLLNGRVIVHVGASGPTKVMRYWTNIADSAGLCPAGQTLVSPAVSTASGWEYFDAPFRCVPIVQQATDWFFVLPDRGGAALLAEGWSDIEPNGVWTDRSRSVLAVPLPRGREIRQMRIMGVYFRPGTTTDVTINGVKLGRMRLDGGLIQLPESARRAPSLRIVLRHEHPMSLASLGMSDDVRLLAFFLQGIHLEP